MSCRCDDICDAKNDVSVLENIADRMMDIELYFTELGNFYAGILNTFGDAVYSTDSVLENVRKKIENKSILIEDDIGNYKKYMNDQIIKLENRISSLEQEDEEYHDDDDD